MNCEMKFKSWHHENMKVSKNHLVPVVKRRVELLDVGHVQTLAHVLVVVLARVVVGEGDDGGTSGSTDSGGARL